MGGDSKEPLDVETAIIQLVYLADLKPDLGQSIEEPDEGIAPWAEGYDPDLEETYRELLRPILDVGGDAELAARKERLKAWHHQERHARAAIDAAGSAPAVLSDRDAREFEAVLRKHGGPLRDALAKRQSVIARSNILAGVLARGASDDPSPVGASEFLRALDGFERVIGALVEMPDLRTTRTGHLLFRNVAFRVYALHCEVVAAVLVTRPWEGDVTEFDDADLVVPEDHVEDLLPAWRERTLARVADVLDIVRAAMPTRERPKRTTLAEIGEDMPLLDGLTLLRSARLAALEGWAGIGSPVRHAAAELAGDPGRASLQRLTGVLVRGHDPSARRRLRATWERIRAAGISEAKRGGDSG